MSGAARRDEIQGLRAIGALLVATFHIWIGRVSGGVDVFFVVSGYLLVGSLVRQFDRSGGIDIVDYVAGLMRRLLPASLFVLLVVGITLPLWMPATRWDVTVRQVAAAAAYVENWKLAFDAVDYLHREEVGSPVQHYWAMSAQVQALVLLGVALFGLGLVRGRRPAGARRAAVLLLAAVTLASFAYALVRVAADQPFTYYDTFARVWEFGLGGLAATVLRGGMLPRRVATVGGWIGLLAIVSCGFVLQVSTAFPGVAALWPTLGAVLVLVCTTGDGRYSVRHLLKSRPLQFIGDNSYALYLWHWPVLVLYLTRTSRVEATLAGGCLVLAVSLLLAKLTTDVVEGRARTALAGRPVRALVLGSSAVALLVGGAVAAVVTIRLVEPREQLLADDPVHYPGARSFGQTGADARYPLMPGPLWVHSDRSSVYADKCHQTLGGTAPRFCSYGPTGGPVIALVGGSHAAHWLGALRPVAERHGWRILTFTKSSCLFSLSDASQTLGSEASCAAWNRNVMARLLELRPQLVFTTATRAEGGQEHVPPGYRGAWRLLNDAGIAIVAIRDTPWLGFDSASCVEINGPASPVCTRPRRLLLADPSPMASVAPTPLLHPLDLTEDFCDASTCPAARGNLLMYYDNHHVTTSYMRTVAPLLERRMGSVMAGYQLAAVTDRGGLPSGSGTADARQPALKH